MNVAWHFLSIFGDIRYWIGFAVCSLITYFILNERSKKRMVWVIFSMLPAVLFSYQLSYVLKLWFKIPRPCISLIACPMSYSFPSGHTAVMFAFATISVLNIKKRWPWIPIILLAGLVSVSRLFLNYHTSIDIFVGVVVGIFCAYIIQTVYKTFTKPK